MTRDAGVLLVPVANPETIDRLLDIALDLANARDMHILGIHVVEVPPQVPLSEGEHVIAGNGPRNLLDRVTSRCEDAGVSHKTRIRYARDVANGIVSAVRDHGVDQLLMGWRGRPRRRDIILGSFLDNVLGEADCDVFVKRIRHPASSIRSILVPVGEGPHSALAAEAAGAIGASRGANVQLLHIVETDAPQERIERADHLLSSHAEYVTHTDVDLEVRAGDPVEEVLLEAAEEFDLTILGASEVSSIRQKLVGSVAERVGRSAPNQIMLARKRPE